MGNPVKLDEVKALSSKKSGIFDFVLSEDSTKLLVYHNEPFSKGENEKFSYMVFDSGMNKIWDKEIELPYQDEDVTVSDYILDRQGNVHLLAKISDKDTRWIKGKPNFKYIVLSYFQDANELKEFELDLKERSVSEITLRLDAEGNLIVAGFYSNIARGTDEIAGIFFLRIDTRNKSVVSKNVRDFEKSFLANFLDEKQAEKGKELEYFNLNHLEPTPDGGVWLVAEQYHYQQTCYTDPRTGIQECTDNYYYNDIMVIKMDKEGIVQWSKRIPKNQFSTNDGAPYASYLAGFTDEKVCLIFNDNPKNLTATESTSVKYMNNSARSVVVKVVLDMEGNALKNILFSAKDAQTVIQPKITLPISRNSSIIYGAGRRICKFGEISYY